MEAVAIGKERVIDLHETANRVKPIVVSVQPIRRPLTRLLGTTALVLAEPSVETPPAARPPL